MNCRHCGQWNSDQAVRCSFCANTKDALEDATVEVHKSQAHSVEISLPERPRPALPSHLGLRGPEPEFARALRLADHAWQIAVVVGSVLLGFLYLLGRCS